MHVPGVKYAGAADHTAREDVLGRPVFDSIDALLESGLDACVVATPTPDHENTTLALVDAGIHVLVEKPLALEAAACARIEASAQRGGVLAAVGHVERFHSSVAALVARLAEGELGPIESIVTRREGGPPRHRDGGLLLDLGTHDFDLAMWLTGQSYGSVRRAELDGLPPDDAALVIGTMAGDIAVQHRLSWCATQRARDVTVSCAGGILAADTREPGPNDPLQAQLRAFRDLVLGSPSSGIATLADGRRAVAVALSAGLGL